MLDNSYGRKQTSYSYTMTMWVFVEAGVATEKNANTARTKSAFVHLDQAFYCFMYSSQNLRCQIQAERGYLEKTTGSVTVPYGQWVNIQFSFTQYNKGFDLRSYNANRQLQSRSFNDKLNFSKQKPNGKLYILPYFRGRVRDIAIFETLKSLPVATPKSSGNY